MNPLGINLWNWCAGLSEECLGLPEKVARMGFTAVELPMTQPQVPSALADEIRNTGLAVSLCAALGPGRDLSSFDSAVRASTMDYLTTCLETAGQLAQAFWRARCTLAAESATGFHPTRRNGSGCWLSMGCGNWPAVRNITAWYSLLSR